MSSSPPSLEPVEAIASSEPPRPALSLSAILVGPTEDTRIQFLRYVVTGVSALGADFATLYLLTRFGGLHYLVSAIVAFTIGLFLNYALSATWVFGHRVVQNRTLEFVIFAAIGIVGLGFNELGLWLLASVWGMHYLWAKIATSGLVFVWNFVARKLTLFR